MFGKSVLKFLPVSQSPFLSEGESRGRIGEPRPFLNGQRHSHRWIREWTPSSSSLSRFSRTENEKRGWKESENHLFHRDGHDLAQEILSYFFLYAEGLLYWRLCTYGQGAYATWWQLRTKTHANSDITGHTTNMYSNALNLSFLFLFFPLSSLRLIPWINEKRTKDFFLHEFLRDKMYRGIK